MAPRCWITWLALVALGGLAACPLLAQPLGDRAPSLSIPRLHRAPTLDDFADMRPAVDLRDQLRPITGFVQQEPEDGKPASQRTEVYLGYDDAHLYVIFVAFDDEPHKIRAHVTRRENVFSDETVEIQIDTFNDQRRAFSFLTNPYGIQWDAIWTEGQGFDPSWDTVWHSRGRVTDRGYVVWMAIPFKSLRFPPGSQAAEQTWRVIFVRDIPRNNETSFWPRVSSRIEGRLNQSAVATGLNGVSPGRNLWLIPYVAASTARLEGDDGTVLADRDGSDVGVDAKWVLQDRLALDVTANPDFSQVESDQPQVTVNERFEVFFPEKRPFFLENSDYFRSPVNLLFTRRIADPRAGARLTGKVGRYSLGALLIDDEAPGKRASDPADPLHGERALNGVLRLQRDLPLQSNVGLLFTARELGDGHNRVGGFDARIKLDDNWDHRSQFVYASTRLLDGSRLEDPSFSVEFNRQGRKFNTHVHHLSIGRDFRTDLGFVPRTDIRDSHVSVSYNFRPEGEKLVRWQPELFVQRVTDQDGTRLDEFLNPSIRWEFRRQTSFGLFGRGGRERLRRCRDFFDDSCTSAMPPVLPDTDDFSISSVGAFFETRFVAAVDLEVELQHGRTVNFAPPAGSGPLPADRGFAELELTLRPSSKLRIENTYLFTRLEDRATGQEILSDQILRLRFDWQFDRRLSLRAILQYDSTEVDAGLTRAAPNKNWNGDLLLTYLINPWTALYVGYNGNFRRAVLDDGATGTPLLFADDFSNNARQVFVKASYLFRP